MTEADNREVLAGLVERVTFHNDDNGFCVLKVKVRGKRDPVPIIGHAAVISTGEFIQASGSWSITASRRDSYGISDKVMEAFTPPSGR